jgi:hypothetical protein
MQRAVRHRGHRDFLLVVKAAPTFTSTEIDTSRILAACIRVNRTNDYATYSQNFSCFSERLSPEASPTINLGKKGEGVGRGLYVCSITGRFCDKKWCVQKLLQRRSSTTPKRTQAHPEISGLKGHRSLIKWYMCHTSATSLKTCAPGVLLARLVHRTKNSSHASHLRKLLHPRQNRRQTCSQDPLTLPTLCRDAELQ